MKNITKTMLAVLALSASALMVNAQDAGGPSPDDQRPPHQGPGGPGGPGGMRRMPPSPVMEALDANHDGVIDADEIANASAALKKLDKNGDGKLTQDELRPHRPQGDHDGGWRQGPGSNGHHPDGQQPPPPQNPPSDN
ncbi:MAG TPA: EF-hand domain-containing protein [Verrucomicrobiae bacterium]|jgi:hypothetical protein|nr:EF-hand domain-containing protein [Verrucomicrobiae bacterium]